MKNVVIALILLLSFVTSLFAQEKEKNGSGTTPDSTKASKKSDDVPPGFKTDKCSWFPDGNYSDCCIAHDIDYYKGGKNRRASDKRLYRCIKSKKGWRNKIIAPLMFIGVRVGGASFLPTPFRWGFGRKRMKKLMAKAEVEKIARGKKAIQPGKEKDKNKPDN